jgi:hypothetical protein
MSLFRLLLTLGVGIGAFLFVYWALSGSTLAAFIVGLIAAVFAFRDHQNWRSADGIGGAQGAARS